MNRIQHAELMLLAIKRIEFANLVFIYLFKLIFKNGKILCILVCSVSVFKGLLVSFSIIHGTAHSL